MPRQVVVAARGAWPTVSAAIGSLSKELDKGKSVPLRLRALWTLRLIGGADDARLRTLLHDENEHVRTWAIRLLSDTWPGDDVQA